MTEPADDARECETCGKVKPHTIKRIDHDGAPTLCDGCHEERHSR